MVTVIKFHKTNVNNMATFISYPHPLLINNSIEVISQRALQSGLMTTTRGEQGSILPLTCFTLPQMTMLKTAVSANYDNDITQ